MKTAPAPSDRFEPRPYQIEARRAYDAHTGEGGALLVMATGTGKTATALWLCMDVLERGGRVVWLAHITELVQQPLDTLARWWPHVRGGIVQGRRNDVDAPLVFGSVNSLVRGDRLTRILEHGAPELVVVDEAHHSPSRTHTRCIEALTEGGARLMGLSATPERDDGADLSETWEIVYSYDIVAGVADGYLVPPYATVARLSDLDLSAVHSTRRDYDDGELGRALLLAGIVEHTVAQLGQAHAARRLVGEGPPKLMRTDDRAWLVFTATVEQAQRTSDALREAGWRSRCVSGKTSKGDRKRLVNAFRRGELDVLCNAAVFTEGTDFPRVAGIVLARPTKSRGLYLQMLGRGLRLHDDADDCLVLDLAGATEDHSLISAPVLIGGSRCADSPNGVHAFGPVHDSVKGECRHCGATVSCYASTQVEGDGSHSWDDTAHCTHCGRAQCEDSDDARHAWVPLDDGKRECLWCGMTVADPHAGMVGRRTDATEDLNVDYVEIDGVTPRTWAVDVDPHGYLFVLHGGEPGMRVPVWLKKGGRKPRHLCAEPVDQPHTRALIADLIRRSQRQGRFRGGRGPVTPAQRRYGERLGVHLQGSSKDAARDLFAAKARERALSTGIVEVGE